ncbi:MAG: hypothetical protein EZS28_005139 [Streblomastix strix]|uniref:Uncharacterized protein n=1 Tax=Streblomastix strix TaxID=222440 RepID=A0A5J4WWC6_9EUKA|nr:MAG: hypothetical protein EZS28_005139 [Streblomastix strix]
MVVEVAKMLMNDQHFQHLHMIHALMMIMNVEVIIIIVVITIINAEIEVGSAANTTDALADPRPLPTDRCALSDQRIPIPPPELPIL